MLGLGSLSFISPWLLLGLAALPMLWWLLRLTPPTPRRVSFPAIRLLFDLVPQEETPYRTPLWLILMRLLLAALVILGFAGPLLNAHSELQGKRALMLVPEISLTPQTIARCASRFPNRVAVLHSALTQRQRQDGSRIRYQRHRFVRFGQYLGQTALHQLT